MPIDRELPFNTQVEKVKNKIRNLVETFQDDTFDTDDLSPPKRGMTIKAHQIGKIDEPKVLRYLNKIGEIFILNEDGYFIEFKVTEKFGKLPSVTLEVPLPEHLIGQFKEETQMMVNAYVMFAVFENNLRLFILNFLEKNKGKDWWDNSVPEGVKRNVEIKKNDSNNKWHIEIPKHEIQYTDFKELKSIITYNTNWELFETVFHDQEIIKSSLTLLETPRNTIAHSNVLSKEMCRDLKSNINKVANLIDQYEALE